MELITDKKAFNVHFSKTINGKEMEFVYHEFEDKLFLIITEFKSIANFYEVRFDTDRNVLGVRGNPLGEVLITIVHNYGADKDEYRGAIEFLINKTKLKSSKKNIIINFGLRDVNGSVLREIAAIIDEQIL